MKPEDAISQVVIQMGWTEVGVGVVLLAAIQFLIGIWIKARIEGSIKHSYDQNLEEIRFQMKVREQAAKVAEYMEKARNLGLDSSAQEFQRANQLAWELAMWLPADIYKLMAQSLVNRSKQNTELHVLIAVRQLLLGNKAGDLTSDNILFHDANLQEKLLAANTLKNMPNQAVDSTATRVTPPAEQEPRHGQP